MVGDCERSLLAGMDAYLGKPYTAARLVDIVRKAFSANGK